jgi:hypothetical protein
MGRGAAYWITRFRGYDGLLRGAAAKYGYAVT